MFTGIVQAVGTIRSLDGGRLIVDTPTSFQIEELGESVAVNGCCLTAISTEGGLAFDLSDETRSRTSLGSLKAGSQVNLERAATLATLFGGHIVQGHVDCTGILEEIRGSVFRFLAPAEFDRYLIDKGSITVDGISLTLVAPERGSFDTWIIPHTLANTNLQSLTVGHRVNLEFDVIAKHVEKLLSH
ncbi:MAG: riboflavin synthase [Fimbriimonas sp.]